jgi:ATP/maltotriose-dependent transcriptional regulator MalT
MLLPVICGHEQRCGRANAPTQCRRSNRFRREPRPRAAFPQAEKVLTRKHTAWAHKLFADIELLEGNPEKAATECRTACEILANYPCPFIEWKVLLAARQAAVLCGDSDDAERMLNKARNAV